MKGAVRFKGRKPSKNQTFGRIRGIGVLAVSCLMTVSVVLLVFIRSGIASPVLHQMGLSPAAKSGSSVADTSKAVEKAGNIAPIQAPLGIDAGNALIAQSTGTSAGGAVYDPMRRIVKIVETTSGSVTSTKQFVWDGDQLCEERDGSGNVTKRFFDYGQQNGSTNYFYNRDHLGSVREMTDSSGNVAAAYNYDPYGRMSKLAGSVDSDMQYAGMYKHERSGLSLAVNRQYSPSLGRWLTRDPSEELAFEMTPSPVESRSPIRQDVGNQHRTGLPFTSDDPVLLAQIAAFFPINLSQRNPAEQSNLYRYVANDPINLTDPSGLAPWGYCHRMCSELAAAVYRSCRASHNTEVNCRAMQACAYASCMWTCLRTPRPEVPEINCGNCNGK